MGTTVQIGKISKVEAGYGDVSKYPVKIRSCGICDHFRSVPGSHWYGVCNIVAGPIRAEGGCKLFSPEVIPCDVLPK